MITQAAVRRTGGQAQQRREPSWGSWPVRRSTCSRPGVLHTGTGAATAVDSLCPDRLDHQALHREPSSCDWSSRQGRAGHKGRGGAPRLQGGRPAGDRAGHDPTPAHPYLWNRRRLRPDTGRGDDALARYVACLRRPAPGHPAGCGPCPTATPHTTSLAASSRC